MTGTATPPRTEVTPATTEQPTATTPLQRTQQVLAKDIRLGPRSPLLVWALAVPLVMTLLVQGVFGSLLDQQPRLGILDAAGSAVAAALATVDGIEVSSVSDEADLLALLERHDLDAGLILPAGFDAEVRAGARPQLQLYVAGDSLASDRLVVAVTTTDLVREVAGQPPPVDVTVTALGEAQLDFALRSLPLLVMFAVAIAGAMVPAMSLVEEKEKRTLDALLITPVEVVDVLAAKGLLGVILASVAGLVTLALNDAFGADPWALAATIVVAAVMMAEVGLLLGSWAPDTNMLFTAWKSGGIVLFLPTVFYLFPDLPQWIARLSPTYYFIDPLFRVAIEGASFADVAPTLGVGLAIIVVLAPVVLVVGRWMEARLGTRSAPTLG